MERNGAREVQAGVGPGPAPCGSSRVKQCGAAGGTGRYMQDTRTPGRTQRLRAGSHAMLWGQLPSCVTALQSRLPGLLQRLPRPLAVCGGAMKGAAAMRPSLMPPPGPAAVPPAAVPPLLAPALLRHAYSHPSCLQPIHCSSALGLAMQCVQGVAGGPETCWGLPLQGALHPTLRWQHAACSTTCSAWYDAHASSFTLRDELQVQVLRGTDGPGTSDLDYCSARALERGLWQLMDRG